MALILIMLKDRADCQVEMRLVDNPDAVEGEPMTPAQSIACAALAAIDRELKTPSVINPSDAPVKLYGADELPIH